ncbi:hypothetical protein [Streptomyces sp. GSL17-111]|uniref:hypothetical protein n=1 Tax=Streptomyces sp. GSL17-111 TaxID=3121596 RepID=UPI0030F3C57E
MTDGTVQRSGAEDAAGEPVVVPLRAPRRGLYVLTMVLFGALVTLAVHTLFEWAPLRVPGAREAVVTQVHGCPAEPPSLTAADCSASWRFPDGGTGHGRVVRGHGLTAGDTVHADSGLAYDTAGTLVEAASICVGLSLIVPGVLAAQWLGRHRAHRRYHRLGRTYP